MTRWTDRLTAPLWLLACLCMAGCTYETNLQGPGTLTVRTPGTLPPVRQPPPAPAAPPQSGVFEGSGPLSSSAGSGCRREIPVRNFVVTGNRVRFQGFRGTIQPDSFVQMQAGERFLYGYFDGERFTGHFWQPHPDCTYDLVLTRVR